MIAEQLLSEAEQAGLELVLREDGIRIRGPRPLPEGLVEKLRAHREELLAAVAPGGVHEPLDVDYELAMLCGPDGARREFLGAVHLVAHFDGEEWPVDRALADLASWWGRPVDSLEPVEWIISAAHADRVRAHGRTWRGDR